MLISTEKYKIPDYCPPNCPYSYELFENQFKAYCYTCPIFICKTTKLIKPEDFPEINSCAWWNFFRNNMQGTPDFYIKVIREKYGEIVYDNVEK